MRKIRFAIAAFAVASIAAAGVSQGAAEKDPFGGSEEGKNTSANFGNTSCGTGTTAIPKVGEVKADPSKGVYVCNDGKVGSEDSVLSSNPSGKRVEGRVFVYKDPANGVHIVVDGDDRDNEAGAAGWNRTDLNSGGKVVCFRRGTAGQAWNGTSGNGSSDRPDAPPNAQNNNQPICVPA